MHRNNQREELQGEILRSIYRVNLTPDKQQARVRKGLIRRSEATIATAAQLFAACNGWQYKPEWHLHEIEEIAPRCEKVRIVLHEALMLFVDDQGEPVAFASQPLSGDRRFFDRVLHEMWDMGVYASASPALFASVRAPWRRQFFVFTRRRQPVRWLPEQEETNSPFSLHESEAPTFKQFLWHVISRAEEIPRALEHVRCVAMDQRYRAMPARFVSFGHFASHFAGLSIDTGVLAILWIQYAAWSKEQTSLILQFDKEIAEVGP
jgi:hypothetical protein